MQTGAPIFQKTGAPEDKNVLYTLQVYITQIKSYPAGHREVKIPHMPNKFT